MKRYSFLFLLIFIAFGCADDDELQNNPYLINERFSFQVNLDLPQYNPLNFPGNHVVLENLGLNGVVIYNLNNSQYRAFELSDPNHPLRECSRLTVTDLDAECGCDDRNTYEIITGQPVKGNGLYPLKEYRTDRSGSTIIISN